MILSKMAYDKTNFLEIMLKEIMLFEDLLNVISLKIAVSKNLFMMLSEDFLYSVWGHLKL